MRFLLAGLITGKCGMRMEPESLALAEDMLNRSKKSGRELKYVTQRGEYEPGLDKESADED